MSTTDEKREKALADVKLYMANDWEVKEETPEYFLLTRKKKGSCLIHLLLLCLTAGVGNVIYYFMAKDTKKVFK